jgi:hypothetical protein
MELYIAYKDTPTASALFERNDGALNQNRTDKQEQPTRSYILFYGLVEINMKNIQDPTDLPYKLSEISMKSPPDPTNLLYMLSEISMKSPPDPTNLL